jgi:hypothetical protein
VLASLKQLQDQYHPNYENRSHYDELVSQAATQMKMDSAASRHAATASYGPLGRGGQKEETRGVSATMDGLGKGGLARALEKGGLR